MEPSRDHQVDDQEEIALEGDDETLAQAVQSGHPAAMGGRERRIERAQDEWAGQSHPLERGAADAQVERLEVDGNVGQLRHAQGTGARARGRSASALASRYAWSR